MVSEKPYVAHADAQHITSRDGHVFHVSSGYVTTPGSGCDCSGPDPVHEVQTYREAVPQLQISLTDACNLGCTYCSFRDRVHADGKPVTMPLEVVRQGVDMHSRTLVGGQEDYTRIDFGLAGETMLVRHLHDRVHSIIEDGLADSAVSVVWAGPMVTNATLSLDPELADRLGPPQDISIDGPRHVHDRVRFYANGRGGTYDDVRAVLSRVLAREPDMGVSAVLTAYCTDFTMIFEHLFTDVGARNIYMKPVNATHDKDYALNEENLPSFKRGYSDLVDHILAQPPEGVLARLLALNEEDFFMRFFHRVKDRAVQVYRCGAGKSGTYLDTNGRLYPCAHFIGKHGWHIGDVGTGVEEGWRRRFLDLTVDRRTECSGCPSRYVCGGGCHYQAVLVNGDISKPDAVKCELIRFLTAEAVRMLVYLREHHPDIVDALPAPYGLASHLEEATPTDAYFPLGRLTAAEESLALPLGGMGRTRSALPQGTNLEVEMEVHRGKLELKIRLPRQGDDVRALRLWFQPLGAAEFTMRDLTVRKPGDSGDVLKVDRGAATWRKTDRTRFRRVPYPSPEWTAADDVRWAWATDSVRLEVPIPCFRDRAEGGGLGFNLFVDFADGGWTALALHEPFVLLDVDLEDDVPLALDGPERQEENATAAGGLNAHMPHGLTPLGRWTGLQANTC